jgi:hypothetical protein
VCHPVFTPYENSNVLGGQEYAAANTVTDCQAACLADVNCTGIDFNSINPVGWQCYLLFTRGSTINIGLTAGITHYELKRNCLADQSTSVCRNAWTIMANSNVYDGQRVGTANSPTDCQSACVNNANCTAVDYSPANPTGYRCFLLYGPIADTQINRGVTGVNHYSLTRSCCPITWYVYADSNEYGGWAYSQAVTMDDCLEACRQNGTCTAVDVDLSNVPGYRCYLLTANSDGGVINVGQTPGVQHLELRSECCSPTWTNATNVASFGAVRFLKYDDVTGCLGACAYDVIGCAAAEYRASTGECWIQTNASQATGSTSTAAGVTQYVINAQCYRTFADALACRDDSKGRWTLFGNSSVTVAAGPGGTAARGGGGGGGSVVAGANTLDACLGQCLGQSSSSGSCTGVQFSSTTSICTQFNATIVDLTTSLTATSGVDFYAFSRCP